VDLKELVADCAMRVLLGEGEFSCIRYPLSRRIAEGSRPDIEGLPGLAVPFFVFEIRQGA